VVTFTLYKISAPGWEKVFDTEEERRLELYEYICPSCREGPPEGEPEFDDPPVTAQSSIMDMLCTPCGCEFGIGEDYE
jgi:hypothetical protein